MVGAEGKQDEACDTSPPAIQRTVISIGADAEPEDSEGDTVKPLPDRLVTELTAYRTLALQDALASNPTVAMTALLHTLCLDLLARTFSAGCLQVSIRSVSFPIQAPELNDSLPARAIAKRQAAWQAEIPDHEDALWDWISGLDDASRMALLAHCVSHGINALYEKGDRYGAGVAASVAQRRIEQADRLARAVSLDMVEAGWRPTVENYLGRVSKVRILEAVREGRGGESAPAHRSSEEG